MNSEQLQSLAVLALAIVRVTLLWWVWIRMLVSGDLIGAGKEREGYQERPVRV